MDKYIFILQSIYQPVNVKTKAIYRRSSSFKPDGSELRVRARVTQAEHKRRDTQTGKHQQLPSEPAGQIQKQGLGKQTAAC